MMNTNFGCFFFALFSFNQTRGQTVTEKDAQDKLKRNGDVFVRLF